MNSQNARPCPTSMCTALPPQKATDLQQGPNLHINPQNSVIILSFLLICCRAIQMPFSFFLTRWLIMLNVRPLQLPDESIWEQRLLLTDKPTILEEFLKNVPQITTGKPKDVNMGLGNTRILTDYVQSSPGHSSGAAFILRVSPTSHTRLRARDRCTSSTLNGEKKWWSRAKFAWGTTWVSECKMDVDPTWIPTWHRMENVSRSLAVFSKTTSWR